FARRAKRTAELAADADSHLVSEGALRRMLEEHPIPALVDGRGTGGVSYFEYENGVFSTHNLPDGAAHQVALVELTRELVELRIAEYLDRGTFQIKVNHNGSGNPILMPLDRARNPRLPHGWTTVEVDGIKHEANFVKIAVNVLRKSEDEPANVLPAILRRWFGEDAGASGTNHFVELTSKAGRWRIRPRVTRLRPREGGCELDATFSIEESDTGLSVVLEARGGTGGTAAARNTEYTQGLVAILRGLASLQAKLVEAVVESAPAQKLSAEERRIDLDGWVYPVQLGEVLDMKKLQGALSRGQAAVGRKPGAKGPGNATKRMRLVVEVQGFDVGTLGARLVG
ncbi:MAG: hypothetical protein JRH20_05510, partial [Deltaproteobacteria bacterium]|nr:hypothetical protein [Deltaproteobacteria bacterium]